MRACGESDKARRIEIVNDLLSRRVLRIPCRFEDLPSGPPSDFALALEYAWSATRARENHDPGDEDRRR